jgi:hypothetical protein
MRFLLSRKIIQKIKKGENLQLKSSIWTKKAPNFPMEAQNDLAIDYVKRLRAGRRPNS